MQAEEREALETAAAAIQRAALSGRLRLVVQQSDAAGRQAPQPVAAEVARVERVEGLLAEIQNLLARPRLHS